jgi:hypothetical protein
VLTVVGADESLPLLKQRLLVHEQLLDVCLGVLEGATVVPGDAALDGIKRLCSFQKGLYSVSTAWDHVCRAQGVPDAFTVCIAFTDTVAAAMTKINARTLERRTRRHEAAAKRWRSGVDRQVEVGRVRKLQREAEAAANGWREMLGPIDREVTATQEDSQSESTETCRTDSAAEESESDDDDDDDDDDMTEVDSQYEDESDGSDD